MGNPFALKDQSNIITGYTQYGPFLTNGSINIPPGTKRIEAMLCGGGGGGSYNYGTAGGFGGCQIYNIPVIGFLIDYVIGLGGANAANLPANGETTSVSIFGTMYAAVGGGGGGGSNGNLVGNGKYGGAGGGSGTNSGPGGTGGAPFNDQYIWSALEAYTDNSGGSAPGTAAAGYGARAGLGFGGGGGGNYGGAGTGLPGGAGGGGAFQTNGVDGVAGGGGACSGGTGKSGGSLATVSMWGLTGFAGGGPAGFLTGGGGGGMLGAGTNATASAVAGGGNGGLGGGGGGGAGNGGNGFVMFRFYY